MGVLRERGGRGQSERSSCPHHPGGGPRAAAAWTPRPRCDQGYAQTVTPDARGPPVTGGWPAHRTLTHLLSSSYLDLEQKKGQMTRTVGHRCVRCTHMEDGGRGGGRPGLDSWSQL